MEEQNELRKKLERFPSFFRQHRDIKLLSKTIVGEIIERIKSDTDFLISDVEIARSNNVLGFLYFCINDQEKAYEMLSKVIAIDPDNIIAINNRAWMNLLKKQSYKDIEDAIERLHDISRCQWISIKADAEIAYLYSRMGLKFYTSAIHQFELVLERAHQLRSNTNVDKNKLNENISLWSFGFGLMKKRCLNLHSVTDTNAITRTKETVTDVIQLFRGITDRRENVENTCSRLCMGRSYVQLGLLMDSVIRDKFTFPKGWAELDKSKDRPDKPDYFFDKAYELCPEDAFVLEKSGKYFRYANDIDKSIKFLKEALQIKATSFGHHHLALSLKRKVEWIYPDSRQKPGLGRKPNQTAVHPTSAASRRSTEQRQTAFTPAPGQYDSGIDSLQSQQSTAEQMDASLSQVIEETQRLRLADEVCEPQEGFDIDIESPNNTEQQPNKGSGSFREIPCMPEPGFRRSSGRRGDDGGRLSHSRSVKDNPHMTECRQYAPSKDHLRLMNLIKCPRKINNIDCSKNQDEVDQIISHLDKAIALASTNYEAFYDKGLLFRQINKPKEALDIFRKIVFNEHGTASIILLANSYEQAAYSLRSISERQGSKDNLESLEADIRCYLKLSTELSCSLVAKIPDLKNCWLGPVTLKEFLNTKPPTKTYLKDLQFLHQKLDNYEGALDILNELKSVCDNEYEQREILHSIVELHVKKNNFDDAILALGIIRCSPLDNSQIKPEMFVNVNVKGGIEALQKGQHEIAKLRFKNALEFVGSRNISEDTRIMDVDSNDTTDYDVFLLCENELEDKWDCIAEILNDIGLTATINTKSILSGPMSHGLVEIMQTSKHFLIAVEGDKMSKSMQHYVDVMIGITLEDNVQKSVVVLYREETKIPTKLKRFACLNVDVDILKVHEERPLKINPEVLEVLEGLLVKLGTSGADHDNP